MNGISQQKQIDRLAKAVEKLSKKVCQQAKQIKILEQKPAEITYNYPSDYRGCL